MIDTKSHSRIQEVLQALEAAWRENPELHLGQLLVKAVNPENPSPEFYHMHDQEIFNRLRKLVGESKSISHITPAWGNVFLDLGFSEEAAIELKNVHRPDILKQLESVGAAQLPTFPEHYIGKAVWIAGVEPCKMTEGKIVHIFEMYGQKQYVIEIETHVDSVLFLRNNWTMADKPDIGALGLGRGV